MTVSYRLTILGQFRLRDNDRPVCLPPTSRRLLALLATLGPEARTSAACRLWPDLDAKKGASNLRTVIWRLKVDAPDILLVERNELELQNCECDLPEVREWARRTVAGEQPWPLPQHAALELLPSWDEDWLIEPREELRLLQLHALELSSQRFLMSGRTAEACSSALAAVRLDPLRESSTRLLIEIHLREGNALEALRRFHRYRDLLRREVGVDPSPAVMALIGPLAAAGPRASAAVRRLSSR
jgi:DNA-binding SARP family transcriptional activator